MSRIDDPKASNKLEARHISMMAIGGSIGTGLFLTSSRLIDYAGIGGSLLALLISGAVVYSIMESLAELASRYPSSSSFSDFGSRFIHPSVGFILGWNYWINWVVTISVEIAALQIFLCYWLPSLSLLYAGISSFTLVLFINLLSPRGFAEVEYYISLLKVLAILAFLFVGSYTIITTAVEHGFNKAFCQWVKGPLFRGGFRGFLQASVISAFAFQGTEIIGIAAGDSKDPAYSIPKAVNTIFLRICLFYIGSNFITSTLGFYGSAGGDELFESPFTQLFSRSMGPYASGLVNLILISAIFSSANSGLYASSRMLKGMGEVGMAPKYFAQVNSLGISFSSLLVTFTASFALFLMSCFGFQRVFEHLMLASSLAGIITWLGISVSHVMYRRSDASQEGGVFRARCFPIAPILSIAYTLLAALGVVIFDENVSSFSLYNILTSLSLVWIELVLFLIHNRYTRARWGQNT